MGVIIFILKLFFGTKLNDDKRYLSQKVPETDKIVPEVDKIVPEIEKYDSEADIWWVNFQQAIP